MYSVGGSTVYSYKNRITVGVLVYVNLINYMDRLTIAGKPDIILGFLELLIFEKDWKKNSRTSSNLFKIVISKTKNLF